MWVLDWTLCGSFEIDLMLFEMGAWVCRGNHGQDTGQFWC